jgi:ABC-type branched-subunit amino acid transport system substrate-binding protein
MQGRAGKLRLSVALGVSLVAPLALVAAAFGRTDSSAAPTASDRQAVACSSARIGAMGPWTGPAASIGQEQLKWARYGLASFNRQNKTTFKLREADTQLNPAQAATRATQLKADPNVVVTIGPAGSQEVQAVARTFAGMAYISASATNTALTIGSKRIKSFFRVVGNDSAQAATDATFIRTTLKGDTVWIIDDQTSYSVPLANGVQSKLRAAGSNVTRESVNQNQTDFSSLVTRISSDTDVVFLPWQLAPRAATFYQQLREQGKRAVILGSDGLDSGDFIGAANGSYFSAFAPDIRRSSNTTVKRTISGYTRQYGAKAFQSNFGPPMYVATQAAHAALRAACADGQVTRAEVLAQLPKVSLGNILLGGGFKFNKNNDPATAKFYLFRVVDGKAQFVR